MSDGRIRIVIVDDHPLMCEGLRGMLEPMYLVLDVVHDGRDVLGALRHYRPDILLLDISLPGRTGLELLREIRSTMPQILVVMLTMHTERVYADEAIAAGAAGYLLKSSGATELRFAIDEVLAGRCYVTPLLPAPNGALTLTADEDEDDDESVTWADARPRALYAGLTGRQQEVLRLLAEGLTTTEIGQRLGISTKTVEFHRHGIRQELGLTSPAALVRFAVAAGVISP